MSETGLQPPSVDPSAIAEVADGVWVIPDRRVPLVPNVGIVLGDEAALVVDTGMGPANGALVLDAARAKAGGRRLLLTLTHFHPEHGYGAQAEELRAKGVAYVEMFRTFGPAVAEALEGVELVEADETYDGLRVLDLGGRSVRLREVGVAHTRGDQVVLVEDAGVLFPGDLVEEGCFPIFPYFPPEDVDVDGNAWIAVLERLEALDPTIVVPGHGEVAGPELITAAREYLELVRDRTADAVSEGLDADAAVAELEDGIRSTYPSWDAPEWIGFAIRAFHARRAG
jgi:glyoxylase-like metal-dependent hydrolase (beta-lactamase superfamily II)